MLEAKRRSVLRAVGGASIYSALRSGSDGVGDDIDYDGQPLRNIKSITFSDGTVQDTAYTGSSSGDGGGVTVADPTVISRGFKTGNYTRGYRIADYPTGGEAIQAALDDLPPRGGEVVAPAGAYDVPATLTVPGGDGTTTVLRGRGSGRSSQSGGTLLVSTITDGSDVIDGNHGGGANRGNEVRDLAILGNPDGYDRHGVYVKNVNSVGGIHNVAVVNNGRGSTPGDGFHFVNCYNQTFSRLFSLNPGRDGFRSTNCNASTFRSCHANGAADVGAPQEVGHNHRSATAVSLESCNASGWQTGAWIGGRGNYVSGYYSESCVGNPLHIAGSGSHVVEGGHLNGEDTARELIKIDGRSGLDGVVLAGINGNYKRSYAPGDAYMVTGVNAPKNVHMRGLNVRNGDGKIDPGADWGGYIYDYDRDLYQVNLDTQHILGIRPSPPRPDSSTAVYLDDGSNTGDGTPGWRVTTDGGASWVDV